MYSGDVILVDHIWADVDYWVDTLLPKLKSFYVHIAREIRTLWQILHGML